MGIITISMIIFGIIIAQMIKDAPTLESINFETPLSSRIYDQNGMLIGTMYQDENRVKVDIQEVPEEVINGIISIEDKRFYEHKGIDLRRLLSAVLGNIKNGWGAEGGSTITQQVIKRSALTPEKTLKRKVQEAWLALQMEQEFSKEEILEIYLNNIYFGNRAYGINTATEVYFQEKELSELNLPQIALLAGLPNAPSAYDPFKQPEKAKHRRDQVLKAMENNHVISKKQADEAINISIADTLGKGHKNEQETNAYNAVINQVYEELVMHEKVITDEEFFQGGLKIYTTVNSDAQQEIHHLLHAKDIPYPDKEFEVGISLINTKTGAIEAIGGGRNFKSIHDKNYSTHVQNQPGSVIKPIVVYGPAIEYFHWSTAHMLDDTEYQYSDGTPINNWDREHWGNVSMRSALEWSRNVPALKTFQYIGSEKAQTFSNHLGIDIDPIYESASIGGFDGVTTLQLAGSYAAFGNGGIYNEPYVVTKIIYPNNEVWEPTLNSHQAMQDFTAYMITDMLKSVMKSGTGIGADVEALPIAGKTGSTNIPKEIKEAYHIEEGIIDSWFVGYTPQHSLAIWTGYPSLKDKNDEIQYIQMDGSQHIAKQLFQKIIAHISDETMNDFIKPLNVIHIDSELYVKDTQPTQPKPVAQQPKKEKHADVVTRNNKPNKPTHKKENTTKAPIKVSNRPKKRVTKESDTQGLKDNQEDKSSKEPPKQAVPNEKQKEDKDNESEENQDNDETDDAELEMEEEQTEPDQVDEEANVEQQNH